MPLLYFSNLDLLSFFRNQSALKFVSSVIVIELIFGFTDFSLLVFCPLSML